MANKLILKNGAGIPAPEKLEVAELALDTQDGSLYSKLNDGTVVQLNDASDSGADVDLSTYVTTDQSIKAGAYYFEGPYQNLSWGFQGGKPYAVRIGQAMDGGMGMDYEPFSIEYKDISAYRIRANAFTFEGSSLGARPKNGKLGSISGFEGISAVDTFRLTGFADTYNDGWHVEAIDINEWSEAEWGDTEVEMGRISGQTGFTNTTNRKLGTIIDGWGNIHTSKKITAEDYLDADGNSIVGDFVPYVERVANEWMAVRTTDFGTSDAITEDGVAVGFNDISITNGGGGGSVSIGSMDGPNGEIVSITTSNNWGNQVPIDMMVAGAGGTSQYVQYPDKFLFYGAPIEAHEYLDKDGNPIMQTLTQAEYDGLTPNANTVYFIV